MNLGATKACRESRFAERQRTIARNYRYVNPSPLTGEARSCSNPRFSVVFAPDLTIPTRPLRLRRSRDNLFAIGNSCLFVNDFTVAAQDNGCRHSHYSILLRNLAAHATKHVNFYHVRLALKVSLDPVHDGFRCQARASRVGKKFQHDGLSLPDTRVEFGGGVNLS